MQSVGTPLAPQAVLGVAQSELERIRKEQRMAAKSKTAIVTGASQGIGAGIVKAFVERGFNVVAMPGR